MEHHSRVFALRTRSKSLNALDGLKSIGKHFNSLVEGPQRELGIPISVDERPLPASDTEETEDLGSPGSTPEKDTWAPNLNEDPSTHTTQTLFDIPLLTRNTTFGYRLALTNSIHAENLLPSAPFDTQEHPPIFLYNILQLPGTLAHILHIDSSFDIIPHMAPTTLHGYYTSVDAISKEPLLQLATFEDDIVEGMLVFGLDEEDIGHLDAYFDDGYAMKEIKVGVELEGGGRVITAYTWLKALENSEAPREYWSLDRFIAGYVNEVAGARWENPWMHY